MLYGRAELWVAGAALIWHPLKGSGGGSYFSFSAGTVRIRHLKRKPFGEIGAIFKNRPLKASWEQGLINGMVQSSVHCRVEASCGWIWFLSCFFLTPPLAPLSPTHLSLQPLFLSHIHTHECTQTQPDIQKHTKSHMWFNKPTGWLVNVHRPNEHNKLSMEVRQK